jgi:hypothetical protein
MTDSSFYQEFMQAVFAKSDAAADFNETIFTETVADFLIDQAIIDEFTYVGFRKETLGIKVDAWTLNEELEKLTLFVTDFRFSPNAESLTAQDIARSFKRVEKYLHYSIEKKLSNQLEESIPAFELSKIIHDSWENISTVHIILLSNAILSKRVESYDESDYSGKKITYDIWEISRLERIEAAGVEREEVVITFENGLKCLPASIGEEHLESYLLVMPGRTLSELYERYGERLLEQNVRTFLQFRGKVNKGIRNTIIHEPEMFFSYNNGISATAEKISTNSDKSSIQSLTNLQVVNGGQTTASIYNAWKKNRADLENVFVQVKLTVIDNQEVDEIVPKISEFANTQNRVSAADFFSNHPFHLRIEEFSRRLWAPSSAGGLRETHWFYERARGQYGNAQSNMTPTKRKEFQGLNPRAQMFTKTDLAKFINSYSMQPNLVSMGAQKNFAKFASEIGKSWESHDKEYNELYFERLIAKAIMFRYLDKNIMRQEWYGGYKANIVTYSIAKLVTMVKETGRRIDLERIWSEQKLPGAMEEQLLEIAEAVNYEIQDTPEGFTNVTEWCKRAMCWEKIQDLNIDLSREFYKELIYADEAREHEHSAQQVQKIHSGIEIQAYVIERGPKHWARLLEWASDNQAFNRQQMSIIESACFIPKRLPSEKQAMVIKKLEEQATQDGFYPDPK